ncbi:MAG TPA: hypothetical protein VE465_27300 [Streptosporangiaceae bacterium]|nr:hypothetical protein [Streptosporangiaceae bacterium]
MTAVQTGERTQVRAKLRRLKGRTASRAAAITAACAVAVSVAQAGAMTPANAVAGLNRVSAASVFDSSVSKAASVACPANQVAVGGGATIGGGGEGAAVTRFAPLPGGTGFEARAYEDRVGYAANWALRVYAVCADPVAGYEIHEATSAPASPSSASASVSCTAGKQLLGTGAAVAPGRGRVILTASIPVGDPPTSVTASGEETEGGYPDVWTVTAWAICADPVPGHAKVVSSSGLDSASPKSSVALCPAGTTAHGTGVLIAGGSGEVKLAEVIPGPGVTPTLTRTLAYEDQNGYNNDWEIRSFVICAT